ncbi:hypothetical protein QUB70_14760 [Microcoleus sp. A003_D6]|uniref:hypothetical protein n=1 Tax=Microcoleus sp. A003_D6 TaxID=3055266 RepID=UPI002FD574B8
MPAGKSDRPDWKEQCARRSQSHAVNRQLANARSQVFTYLSELCLTFYAEREFL